MTELSVEVRPRWPFRLPRFGGPDGVARVREGAFWRLLHVEGEPVVIRARQPAGDRVLITAHSARRDAADYAVGRLRFALGVDDDLRAFHDRFRWDPLIGRAVRRNPYLRARRRPEPFEALAWAVCEQLIDFARAAEIQRRIVRRLGRRCPRTGLRDPPPAARIGRTSPALLESLGLSGGRAVALVRAAREVAAGRIDLHAADHERAWRRLRAIPGIGRWTIEMVALHGQGRLDQLPAGDLTYLKLVGRLRTGNPFARAGEEEVRELFARYDPWAGLAAAYLYAGRLGGLGGRPAAARRQGPAAATATDPGRAGTRW